VPTRIETPRLQLVLLPAVGAAALPGDRAAVERLIEARLPDGWPLPDLLDILPIWAAARPEDEPFGIWLIVERATNTVAGDIGFHGPPDADGRVEVGFSVLPDRRRRGYASEAARAIVEWAVVQPAVREVVARSDVDNVASARTLTAAGFRRLGERDGVVDWRWAGEAAGQTESSRSKKER
jgi:[ribosomal protein S5]-alanine N-acetyltransferase